MMNYPKLTMYINLYILIGFFGFFVKWHINLCRLFYAKAILIEEQ